MEIPTYIRIIRENVPSGRNSLSQFVCNPKGLNQVEFHTFTVLATDYFGLCFWTMMSLTLNATPAGLPPKSRTIFALSKEGALLAS